MSRFKNNDDISDLLKIYLGGYASEAVAAGGMHRGETLRIVAAIMLADVRGSTRLLQNLETDAYLQFLNHVYDLVVPEVLGRGGELLQFTGDGLLAVFLESEKARDLGIVCDHAVGNAYAAAIDASKAVKAARLPSSVGFGLSYGPVEYGSVGTEDRLSLTVISAEVSRADRLQQLCPCEHGSVAMSELFAENLKTGLVRSPGRYPLKGFTEAEQVYFPADGM